MAVLETPWFMKTKTSDLGRINKVFDERFQASIALIQLKQRKTIMKLNDEIKTIKSEFKHIRSEVDFSKDLDEHGKLLDEKAIKAKESGRDGRLRGRKHGLSLNTARVIPPELELERQRYMRLRQRDRRREMTMIELRDMCHRCVNGDRGDEANKYIQRAKSVLFPKIKQPKRLKSVEININDDVEDVDDDVEIDKVDNEENERDNKNSLPRRVPKINIESGISSPDSVPMNTDRKSIRPSSAASVASAGLKHTLPRYKSMDVVGLNDIPNTLGLML
ncbi:hypothetical protein ACF0H5_008042 [Mactra antiquata]